MTAKRTPQVWANDIFAAAAGRRPARPRDLDPPAAPAGPRAWARASVEAYSMKYCSGRVMPGVRQVTESRIVFGTLWKLFLTTP
ncbi:hypothetical protein GCM10023317_24090 [Actinopolymorpha pittospori]